MGVQVLEASDEDMLRLFTICSLAFDHNEPVFDASWPNHWTEAGRQQGASRFKEIKNRKPEATFLKAVDDAGRIVGFAKWNFYVNNLPDFNEKDENDYWNDPDAKALAGELAVCFLKTRNAAIVRTGGNLASLDILAIDPESQRQGAGGALVAWGLNKADGLGIESVVESSVFGKGLYAKHGFVFQKTVQVRPESERFAGKTGGEFAWFERAKATK